MNDIDKICRICLEYSSELTDLFGEESEIHKKIEYLIPGLQVLDSPNWPDKICIKCSKRISNLFTFRELIINHEQNIIERYGPFILKQEYNTSEVPFIEDICNNDDPDSNVKHETNDADTKYEDGDEDYVPPEYEDDNDYAESEEEEEEYKPDLKPGRKPKTGRKDFESARTKEIDATIAKFMPLICSICQDLTSEPFKNFTQLSRHFNRVHNTRAFVQCCNNKFKRRWNLYEHVLHHSNPDQFKCEECGKNFISRLRLKEHMNVHLPDDQKKFTCPTCGKKLATKLKLNHHLLTHIPEEEKQFRCQDCEKRFPSKHALEAHVRVVHKNIRPYVCEFCSKGFLSEKTLQDHIAAHHMAKQPKIKCEHCNKLYTNERTLRKHMKNVMDTTVHKCHLCDHIAPTRSSLNGHVQYKHNQNRSFECSICQRPFKVKKNLEEHMAGHTGVKLYKCLFCPKEFNSNANKYSHQKKKHPIEWEQNMRKQFAD